MKATIIHGNGLIWVDRLRPEFILTDAPHDVLGGLSKLVERHRLAWINASSPLWLTLEHTGEKSVGPYEAIIRAFPHVDTVCDPLMGWGTTGVAALRCGRNFIGIDRQKDRCIHAVERLRAEFPDAEIELK